MSTSKAEKVTEGAENISPKAPAVLKGGEESEEESEVLEESPCGRWQKRREEVQQRDVPGIDCAFLAMDTEEGVEVVWNEVQISEKKSSKNQVEKIQQVFDNLIELEHPNIAKFHKHWTDMTKERPRVIFITEYMSSGSLRQFLRKTKKSNRTLKGWKRWCTQILSALSYLHCCNPPIIHGNLTTDTIFIQHNGLIKIGSVAPDAIYNHVKTRRDVKNLHYVAPEIAVGNTALTTAADVYSFGICALEMAALEMPANGDMPHNLGDEAIQKALDTVEDHYQKDFIARCLNKDPAARPTARDLLFHKVLFEVHALKLLAAHIFVRCAKGTTDDVTQLTNWDTTKMLAEIPKHLKQHSLKQESIAELQKFIEDVRNGVYPLTAMPLTRPAGLVNTTILNVVESSKLETPESVETEKRSVIRTSCQVHHDDNGTTRMTLLLRMSDDMNRQLACEFSSEDTPLLLAEELATHDFINPADIEKIAECIKEALACPIVLHSDIVPPGSTVQMVSIQQAS